MTGFPDANAVSRYRPPRRVKADIGDIILAGAAIDHLLNLALFKLVKIDFREGFPLQGRTTLGGSLAKVRRFVSVGKDEQLWNDFRVLESVRDLFSSSAELPKHEADRCEA